MTASSRKNYSGSSISCAYSVNGLVTSATDSSSGTAHAFAYDNLNRLITEDTRFTGVSGTLTQSWGYDLASNITSDATRRNGSTLFTDNYTYDGMSRLSVLTQSGSSVNDKSLVFGYNANSQAESITRYARVTCTVDRSPQ